MFSIILFDDLKPKGGPSGYLYNLKDSIDENGLNNIKILYKKNRKLGTLEKIKQIFKNELKLSNIFKINRKLNKYKIFIKNNFKDIEKSKILHFHSTLDLYYFSKVYNLDKHTVLLTSHSPEPNNVELYKSLISKGYKQNKAEKKRLRYEEADIYAFRNADFLIFPCEGAVSPYKEFFKINSIDKEKLKYITTSSKTLIPILNKKEFREKYNISIDSKLICYVGRKNEIKGFDIFCKIAEKLKNNKEFFFVSAGTGDIEAPNWKNFIDIGWTNDPASLVEASDIQIIPNRDTYFDIGVIQALSINKPILTTNTGGNSYFLDKDLNIFFADYSNIDSFINILLDNEIYKNNSKNIDFYNNYLSNRDFAKNYEKLYLSLV